MLLSFVHASVHLKVEKLKRYFSIFSYGHVYPHHVYLVNLPVFLCMRIFFQSLFVCLID